METSLKNCVFSTIVYILKLKNSSTDVCLMKLKLSFTYVKSYIKEKISPYEIKTRQSMKDILIYVNDDNYRRSLNYAS